MPKSSREQILDDENKVLTALKRNSHESIDKIAKKCGFSRQKVWRIIKRLEKDHTIWGYTAVVDEAKLGMTTFFLLVRRVQRPVSDIDLDKVLKRTLKKEIRDVGAELECSLFVHGTFDYLICISAPSIKQVKKFCETFNKLFKDSIAELNILEVIFPIERNGIENPNLDDFKDLF